MAIQKISGRAIKLGSDTAGDIMYHNGTGWVRLEKGEAGEVLSMNLAGTAPEWNAFIYPGTQFGYSVMGFRNPATETIEKFSFASDVDAVDHCDAFAANSHNSCCRSDTHGYSNGGEGEPVTVITNRISKFAFASTATGTDVGDLISASGSNSGNSSGTYGYVCGGSFMTAPNVWDTIEKYSVTADLNATDVGDLTVAKLLQTSANSTTHGYSCGGGSDVHPSLSTFDVIESFPFATDVNTTDIANLTIDRYAGSGHSSETHGYTVGGAHYQTPGFPAGGHSDVIDKFLFATGADSTDVGNLHTTNALMGGSSSTENGYIHGGYPNYITRIDKFSFTTDGDAVDIANLTIGRDNNDGTQN